MSVLDSLRKNGAFLFLGLGSAIAALLVMRQAAGEPLFQPQSDYGVVIGGALVAIFVIVKDLRASNGKQNI